MPYIVMAYVVMAKRRPPIHAGPSVGRQQRCHRSMPIGVSVHMDAWHAAGLERGSIECGSAPSRAKKRGPPIDAVHSYGLCSYGRVVRRRGGHRSMPIASIRSTYGHVAHCAFA